MREGRSRGSGLVSPTRRAFHFISGLPRAGSTLTAAILRQNPRFHAGMSSPVASLFDGVIAQVSAGTELSTMVNEAQRGRILRGLFDSYYADLDQPVIFDTNRAWTAQAAGADAAVPRRQGDLLRARRRLGDGLARAAVPQQRVRAHRGCSTIRPSAPPSTPGSRRWRMPTAWSASPGTRCARPATRNSPSACCCSNTTCSPARPGDVFKLIYEFLGEAPFEHDFTKVEYDAPEFDAQLGMDGLHRVRAQVKPQSRKTILPPDLFKRYAQLSFWRDLKDSKAFRIVTQASAEKQRETMPQPAQAIAPEAAP